MALRGCCPGLGAERETACQHAKERRPITASPPAMSRVTLSIYGFRQRFDEQFEELFGRQGVERFPEYAVHLRPEQFEETVGFVRRHFLDRHHHQPQRNFDIGRLDIEFEQFVGVMPVIQITVFTDSV